MIKRKQQSTYHLIFILLISSLTSFASNTIPLEVENDVEGSPITMGIPFPKGALISPDHVRVLDIHGNEIPSQTTLVTTWEPADYSVKWMWVFFFTTGEIEYTLEYGEEIRKAPLKGDQIKIKNAQRSGQSTYVETGPLRFTVNKRIGGFIDNVIYDLENDGFDNQDTIAFLGDSRGSFLDLFDDLGIDSSSAQIHRSVRERGSGPLHAIIRLEGEYKYQREDNRNSPFIIRIHVYAGKSYIKVYHTLTYTGIPDKHEKRPGEHANIALSNAKVTKNDRETKDKGWMEANDRITSTGLDLQYKMGGNLKYTCGMEEGPWHEKGKSQIVTDKLGQTQALSVFQTGPKPDRIPPVPNSTLDERISGFSATLRIDGDQKTQTEKADGWADISDDRWGISIGIKNFVKEYPKEIQFRSDQQTATAFLWSPKADPMSFARASLRRDQGMISNFAEGITKTSELIYHFHAASESNLELKKAMNYVLDPAIGHASPETYSNSKVYGNFAPRKESHAEYERALDYKFAWQLFSQDWEPWYGMFDYGDQKNAFFRDDWFRWQNNEPGIDFMYWLQFMRTGDSKYYRAAEAMSMHTMDVDNIHWPTEPRYYGDTNESIDYFKWKERQPTASPYLGIGRRHANQHWAANLSAHVWLEGWVASYYLTGYHRGLDIAKLSADSYLRRMWGDHGLTGRRLYLSVLNLVEAWDATKDPKYLSELKDRIDRMIAFQHGADQYDNLIIDRYGYSQVYASHALYKYYQITGEEKVKQSLIRHARAVRDNPPYNHEYESYLATIHSLVVGYEFTKDKSFLDEALKRAEVTKTDKISKSIEELGSQRLVSEAIEEVSNLPMKGDFATRPRRVSNWGPTQGLRVFGWTHIYNIPWLLACLDEE